jgi:hypothetical protein
MRSKTSAAASAYMCSRSGSVDETQARQLFALLARESFPCLHSYLLMNVDTDLHPDVAQEFAFHWPFAAERRGPVSY